MIGHGAVDIPGETEMVRTLQVDRRRLKWGIIEGYKIMKGVDWLSEGLFTKYQNTRTREHLLLVVGGRLKLTRESTF